MRKANGGLLLGASESYGRACAAFVWIGGTVNLPKVAAGTEAGPWEKGMPQWPKIQTLSRATAKTNPIRCEGLCGGDLGEFLGGEEGNSRGSLAGPCDRVERPTTFAFFSLCPGRVDWVWA